MALNKVVDIPVSSNRVKAIVRMVGFTVSLLELEVHRELSAAIAAPRKNR